MKNNPIQSIEIIFNKWIGNGLSWWSKIPCGSPAIGKILSSIFTTTSQSACTATSAKGKTNRDYSIGLTIARKLTCPKYNNKCNRKKFLGVCPWQGQTL